VVLALGRKHRRDGTHAGDHRGLALDQPSSQPWQPIISHRAWAGVRCVTSSGMGSVPDLCLGRIAAVVRSGGMGRVQ
jgi:hypothetical protein